jgi:hypothetical protein
MNYPPSFEEFLKLNMVQQFFLYRVNTKRGRFSLYQEERGSAMVFLNSTHVIYPGCEKGLMLV